MVASVVYLLAGQDFSSSPSSHDQHYKNSANSHEPNAINFLNNYNNINRNQRPNGTNRRNETQIRLPTQTQIQSQTISPNIPDVKQNTQTDYPRYRAPSTTATSSTPSNILISSTTVKTVAAKSSPAKIISPLATTNRPFFGNVKPSTTTVKNVKVYTNSNPRNRKLPQPAPKYTTLLLPTADDVEENAVERSKLLFPSKETLENFGFTSGHQNSFGVPIEEDERTLRMLNHQMINSQPKLNDTDDYLLLSITTDANFHQTKVSPTLPNIKKNFASTERIRPVNVTTDDGKLHCNHQYYLSFYHFSCSFPNPNVRFKVFANQQRCLFAVAFCRMI